MGRDLTQHGQVDLAESRRRLSSMLLLTGLIVCGTVSGCSESELTNQCLQVKVVASSPVVAAHVGAWQLEPDSDERTLLDRGTTDEFGQVELKIGPADGLVLVESFGGMVATSATLNGPRTEQLRVEDFTLETIVELDLATALHVDRSVTISPLTSIATALADARFAHPSKESTRKDAVRTAFGLLSNHLGENFVDVYPIDLSEPALVNTPGLHHSLAITAFEALAKRIAAEQGLTLQHMNELVIAKALIDDASDPQAVLDGIGPEGPISVASCRPPETCDVDLEDCRTICDFSSDTWRRDFPESMIFDVVLSERNGTGLDFDDLDESLSRLRTSREPELFGQVQDAAPIDRSPPTLAFSITLIIDEQDDVISFDGNSAPRHEPHGIQVPLGIEEQCPSLSKYVHRLDGAAENPIHFELSAESHPQIALLTESAEYRILAVDGQTAVPVTEWIAVDFVDSADNGFIFRIVPYGSDVPELKTREGRFEIEVRAKDQIGQTGVARACWDHIPLPPPLRFDPMDIIPSSHPDSLLAVDLENNNVAPLLNGPVPPEQSKGVVYFDIFNGTDEPAYITLAVEQPNAVVRKSWQMSYAQLSPRRAAEQPLCLVDGSCIAKIDLPPDIVVTDEMEIVADLVGGVRVKDLTSSTFIQPCAGCDSNEYRLDPRPSEGGPRKYRVMLVATDLSSLAPQLSSETDDDIGGPFSEYHLDPALPLRLSGQRYEYRLVCTVPRPDNTCMEVADSRRYRALTNASIAISWLDLTGRLRAASGLSYRDVIEVEYSADYQWGTMEAVVPPFSL